MAREKARYHAFVRLLVLSDLHANWPALKAVLADAEKRGFDQVLCLGDALGYGPQPREVLGSLRELGASCVLGNHDVWALQLAGEREGVSGPREGGVVARALDYQLSQLTPDLLAWVAAWPEVCDADFGGRRLRLRHGSPTSLLAYVDSLGAAREAFAGWSGQTCLVGHTHVSAAYATLAAPSGEWVKHQPLSSGGRSVKEHFMLPPGARAILNPGSVGQPRDGDARASYALFDAQRGIFEVVRAAYDIAATREAVRAAGLPDVLGARLEVGK